MKTLYKPTTTAASLWFKSLLGDCRFLKSSRNIETFFAGGPKNHRVISRITFYRIKRYFETSYIIILMDLLVGSKKNDVMSRITLYRDSLYRYSTVFISPHNDWLEGMNFSSYLREGEGGGNNILLRLNDTATEPWWRLPHPTNGTRPCLCSHH